MNKCRVVMALAEELGFVLYKDMPKPFKKHIKKAIDINYRPANLFKVLRKAAEDYECT